MVAPAGHRHRLERLCRCAMRPPSAEERLEATADEQLPLRLRHRWTDGTTHLVFEYDVLSRPRCGQAMRLVALIEQADVIRRIRPHLSVPTDVPESAQAGAPPRVYDPEDCGDGVVGGIDRGR